MSVAAVLAGAEGACAQTIGSGSSIGSGASIGSGSSIGGGGKGSGMSGGSSAGSGFGGGMGGSGTTSGRTSGGTTNVIPATADPFRTTYGNPYAIGLSNVSTTFTYSSTGVSTKGFGTPVYATATTSTSSGIQSSSTGVNGEGWDTVGTRRALPFITALSPDIPLVSHVPTQVTRELLTSLENSAVLKDKKGVEVVVQGTTVILKGHVASERERRVVEGMVRMTPGVRDVVNQLVRPPEESAANFDNEN